jgi:manganese efflux pump family protein
MDLLTTFGIALSLAMDAFAVSISTGLVLRQVSGRQTARLAFHFGLFQALMPIIGWFVGREVASSFASYGHWVAFSLLGLIGGKMLIDGLARHRGASDADKRGDPTKRLSLVVLSVATSIDALAIGVSLAMIGVSVWRPALVIGLVTAALTAIGMHLGRRLGGRLGPVAEIIGGLVLIGIGCRIVLERITF